ncbi:MAG: energy transducer TonB [Flavobacterium sp.]
MKKYIFFFLFCFSISGSSQELLMDTEDVHPADVIEPKFNGGGLDKFYEFINKEFDFSKVTKPGKIIFSFTINTLGEIKNIRIVQFPDVESATEVIRVLQKAPKWEPGKRGGKPFSVDIKIPLDFKLKNIISK